MLTQKADELAAIEAQIAALKDVEALEQMPPAPAAAPPRPAPNPPVVLPGRDSAGRGA